MIPEHAMLSVAEIERRLAGPCEVHPRRSGLNEWKTIGMLLRPGESYDDRYAAWCLGRGVKCRCPNG